MAHDSVAGLNRGTPEPPRVSRHPKQLKLRWDPPQECQLKGAIGATLGKLCGVILKDRSLGGAESLKDIWFVFLP